MKARRILINILLIIGLVFLLASYIAYRFKEVEV